MALRETDQYFSPIHDSPPGRFADPPRPFVLRAALLNNSNIRPGNSFSFDLHLFVLDRHSLITFTSAFLEFAIDGLSPTRGRAELQAIDELGRDRSIRRRVWEKGIWCAPESTPVMIDLECPAGAAVVHHIIVEFLTPTELKYKGELIDKPSFPILFARIRERVRTLSCFYNGFNLDLASADLSEAAAHVRMAEASMTHEKAERRSSRTGQRHPLGGFQGTAIYEGELTCFLPWLEAAYWTGVGRQTVWGKGLINTSVLPQQTGH